MKKMRYVASLLGLIICLTTHLGAQNLPVTHERIGPLGFGDPGGGRHEPAGDVDGDGHADYVEVVVDRMVSGIQFRSAVVSGATGVDLDSLSILIPGGISSQVIGPELGQRFFALGDLDGDGISEYADVDVAQVGGVTAGTNTTLNIYSGHPRTLLWQVPYIGQEAEGKEARPLGDVDGDGVKDVGFFIVNGDAPAPQMFIFECRSGATGTLIHRFFSHLLRSDGMADVGDINNDGFDDFVLSSGSTNIFHPAGGSASIFSGADFSILRNWFGQQAQAEFGRDVVAMTDIDADGKKDVAVLATGVLFGQSQVSVHSSSGGQTLWTVSGAPLERFSLLQNAGDTNGDGVDDLGLWVIISNGSISNFTFARVLSGKDGQVLQDNLTPQFATPPAPSTPALGLAISFPGDLNGDGISEISNLTAASLQPFQSSLQVLATATHGAEPYGTPTPGSTLELSWAPSSAEPRLGFIELNGALPNASLFFGVSLAPWNGSTFGANHPLWISPLAQDLFITASVTADVQGRYQSFDTLSRPPIAGISLYIQAAQTTLPDAVSNGLQMLYGP